MSLIILTLLLVIVSARGSKPICFKASCSVSKPLPVEVEISRFKNFMSLGSTPSTVLSLNPGIQSSERLIGDSIRGTREKHQHKWRAELIPLVFPGMKISNSVTFHVDFNPGKSLSVSMLPEDGDTLEQIYDGPRILARLCESFLPQVSSINVLTLDTDNACLTNTAEITIAFELPAAFPIPAHLVSSKGSDAIQAGMNRDLDGLVGRYIERYKEWDACMPVAAPMEAAIDADLDSMDS